MMEQDSAEVPFFEIQERYHNWILRKEREDKEWLQYLTLDSRQSMNKN
jgi:hypothetical protein